MFHESKRHMSEVEEKNYTLATEILHELKISAKRWFIAFCVMIALELATIAGFMWYLTIPTDETVTTQTVDDVDNVDNSDVKQVVGE